MFNDLRVACKRLILPPRIAKECLNGWFSRLRVVRLQISHFLNLFLLPKSSQSILVFILRRLLFKLNTTNKEFAFEIRKFVGQDEVNSLLDDLFD